MTEFTGHTPGPWELGEPNVEYEEEGTVCVRDAKDWVLADVWGGERNMQIIANARLIAAAPRLARHRALLYEASRELVDCFFEDVKPEEFECKRRLDMMLYRLRQIDAEDKEAAHE